MLRLMMAGGGGGGAAQGVTFSPGDKSSLVSISSSGRIATCSSSGGHYYAALTLPKSSGRWQFEIYVDQMSPSSDGNISIGVMPRGPSVSELYPGFSFGSCLWSRQTSPLSRLYSGSTDSTYIALANSTGNIITPGCRCTVAFDIDGKLFSVYKDGALVWSGSVPDINPLTYQYVPAIKSWGSSANPTIASVHPNIVYPVPGFLPWT